MKKVIKSVMLIILFSGLCISCSSEKQENKDASNNTTTTSQESAGSGKTLSGEGLTIGVSVIGTEHNWDINCYNGTVETLKAAGVKVIPFDGERRQEKQLNDVETLISRDVDAIAIILGVEGSLRPAVQKAREEGIPVVTADFAIPESLCNVSTNNFTAMSELTLQMVSDMHGKGEVAVYYRPGAPIAELRRRVFDTVLSSYPGIKIVAEEAYVTPGTVPDAYNKTQDLLRANPDIDAFWTVFDMPMIGAAQAIGDMGLQNSVKCYGFDGDPTAMQMLMDPDSAFAATVAQQPYAIGEELAKVAILAAKGEPLPALKFVPYVLVTPDNVQEVYSTLPQYKK